MTLKINSFKASDFDQSPPTTTFLTDFEESLCDGFFYVRIPKECRDLIPIARQFAKSLKANKAIYAAKTFDKPSGFEQVKGTQSYSLVVRSNQWNNVYTEKEISLAKNMQSVGIKIFKCMLKHIFKIPESDWDLITGKALTDKGRPVFSVMHYAADVEADDGYFSHQDIGWLTLLSSDKDGLSALAKGKWHDVPLKQNHFVLLFGGMMEQLINNQTRLIAPFHRVEKLKKGEQRTTLGLFINSADDQLIYQTQNNGRIEATDRTFSDHVNEGYKKYIARQNLRKTV